MPRNNGTPVQCDRCKFYKHDEPNAEPICIRMPPVTVIRTYETNAGEVSSYPDTMFPHVSPIMRCGEFKRKL